MTSLAKQLTYAPPTFLRCCHFAAFMSKHYSQDQKNVASSSFDNILSDENRQRVQNRLKYVKPVRSEKHVDLRPDYREAAVLVPMCTVNGEPSLLLTLRSRKLVNYRGQVSFPGGNADKSDPDFEYTALRETEEELGIERSAFTVWGHLNALPASDGSTRVHPILAKTGEIDVSMLATSDDEVEEVFTVPIRDLCNTDYIASTRYQTKNSYTLPVFTAGPHRIWGITAVITHMLMNILVPDLYTFKLKHKHDYR